MSLIPGLGRALAHGIDKVHTRHPLVVCELDLARKVVDVAEEAAQDQTVPGGDVGAHVLNDMLGKGRVEAAGPLRAVCRSVCGHGCGCGVV